tara:strand:- start:119 stop:877 length:759 start_codon:yes stop_codon:yes gene_type:complete
MKNLFESWRNFINEATYKVKSGDNLTKIAKAYNLTLQQLLDANPKYKKNPDLIKIGQNINIPDGSDEDPLDEDFLIMDLEADIQDLFTSYYENMNNFKNNLRDCVSILTLLVEDNFESENLKKIRETELEKTWDTCLDQFWVDQVYKELAEGGFQTTIEALGYEESKFKQTLKDVTAATLTYVTNFTNPDGNKFDSNRRLKEITGELQEVKISVAKQAKNYLQRVLTSDRFRPNTTWADVLARYNQVSTRSR